MRQVKHLLNIKGCYRDVDFRVRFLKAKKAERALQMLVDRPGNVIAARRLMPAPGEFEELSGEALDDAYAAEGGH